MRFKSGLDFIGIRDKVLTTKYSIVYMEKEAWPEKKDFLQEQEMGVWGPCSHPHCLLPPGTVTLRVALAHCCIRGSALDTLPGT